MFFYFDPSRIATMNHREVYPEETKGRTLLLLNK